MGVGIGPRLDARPPAWRPSPASFRLRAFWKEIELLHGPGRAGGLFLKRSRPRVSPCPSLSDLWRATVNMPSWCPCPGINPGLDNRILVYLQNAVRTALASGRRAHPGYIPRQDWMGTAKCRAVCAGRLAHPSLDAQNSTGNSVHLSAGLPRCVRQDCPLLIEAQRGAQRRDADRSSAY